MSPWSSSSYSKLQGKYVSHKRPLVMNITFKFHSRGDNTHTGRFFEIWRNPSTRGHSKKLSYKRANKINLKTNSQVHKLNLVYMFLLTFYGLALLRFIDYCRWFSCVHPSSFYYQGKRGLYVMDNYVNYFFLFPPMECF